MKKSLLLSLFCCCALQAAYAQIAHDLAIFSEDGLKFTVFINGEQINEAPKARVDARNIEEDYADVRIQFEDQGIEEIHRKIFSFLLPMHLVFCLQFQN